MVCPRHKTLTASSKYHHRANIRFTIRTYFVTNSNDTLNRAVRSYEQIDVMRHAVRCDSSAQRNPQTRRLYTRWHTRWQIIHVMSCKLGVVGCSTIFRLLLPNDKLLSSNNKITRKYWMEPCYSVYSNAKHADRRKLCYNQMNISYYCLKVSEALM